eukprot:scaffold3461_cov116-Isochrysis_galbana.AAC.1
MPGVRVSSVSTPTPTSPPPPPSDPGASEQISLLPASQPQPMAPAHQPAGPPLSAKRRRARGLIEHEVAAATPVPVLFVVV